MIRIFLFGLLSLLFVSPAHAAWHEASSDHFLIYGNQNPKTTQKFAERLERFHAAMAFAFGQDSIKPSPSNRVTIYVVRSKSKVRKLLDSDNRYVAGFYMPRAGSTIAIVPKLKSSSSKYQLGSETILLHEYAHHFMHHMIDRSFPLWFSEGFAEFYASAKFEKDGSVKLGMPALHRVAELNYSKRVPISMLVDTRRYLDQKTKAHDAFYGRSWLLYHFLEFSDKRKGQLRDYQRLLATGEPELKAAKSAFGDLELLDKDLNKYMQRTTFSIYNISPEKLRFSSIRMRALRSGEAAIIPVMIQSKRGVNEEQAAELLQDARSIAVEHPRDPAVLAALAEAEFDAGNNVEAIAAADRALAIDPNSINAHIQKGYALARMAPDTEDEAAAWKQMRRQFVKLNKIENDHPIPLIQFYRSYREQGIEPPTIAVDGLARALELAPYDNGLRWMMANEFVLQEKYDWAAHTLEPLAYSPHQSDMTERALALLKETEAKALEAKNDKDAAVGS
jgi:tetratricopeptide (TPR) repeat protein